MLLNFTQGIVSYPHTGTTQQFLTYAGGYVSIQASQGPTTIVFAQGTKNYTYTENSSISAWGPLPQVTSWLYWDINLATGTRSFGYTTVQPTSGSIQPTSPVAGQHWFDTSSKMMYVYVASSGTWYNVVRVFAAQVNSAGVFSPLGDTTSPTPYAGSQVGIFSPDIVAGQILADSAGNVVKNSQGQFITTADSFFANNNPSQPISIEYASVPAQATETLSKYSIVTYTAFGQVYHCQYNDVQNGVIAILLEDLIAGETGTVSLQGYISNQSWNWPTVGAKLWVADDGTLTSSDLHTTDPINHPTQSPPVAVVITPTSVYFNQGLGGVGPQGPQGATTVYPASPVLMGIARLSVTAANPDIPVVVGDNDPRNSDARAPLAHTQAASSIIPTPEGILTGTTLQDDLSIIATQFMPLIGGTMTGPLYLSGDPILAAQASTKQYVDGQINNTVRLSGGTMTGLLYLSGNPTLPLGAATKQYVDTNSVLITGSSMTGPLVLSGNPTTALGAATKQYVDSVTVEQLADVTAPSPANGNVLVYNGTTWINSTALSTLTASYNALLNSFPYDVTFSFSGILLSGEILGGNVFARTLTLPANLVGSVAAVDIAPQSTTVLNIMHNGSIVGTVTFAVGSVAGVFALSSTLTIAVGDRLEMQSDPTLFDGNLKNIYVTLKATASLT